MQSPLCLGGGGPENVDYNFHSPADTNASIVGSHFWVYVLQLPRAGQATHTPAYFCWTRTLVIVRKHVLQLCTPRHSYIYQARGVGCRTCLSTLPSRRLPTACRKGSISRWAEIKRNLQFGKCRTFFLPGSDTSTTRAEGTLQRRPIRHEPHGFGAPKQHLKASRQPLCHRASRLQSDTNSLRAVPLPETFSVEGDLDTGT